MANEYVTQAALKATLSLTGETFADADIDAALEAASRSVDGHCRRRFYADADVNQIRYYSPFSKSLLPIDDLVTLTTLKTDPGGDGTFEETWTLNTDFNLLPLNPELIDATNRWPSTQIETHPLGSFYFPTSYPRSVQVTGKFGWAAVPPQVKEATTILAHRLLKRAREAAFGVVGLGLEGGAVTISKTDPDLAGLLDRSQLVRVKPNF